MKIKKTVQELYKCKYKLTAVKEEKEKLIKNCGNMGLNFNSNL